MISLLILGSFFLCFRNFDALADKSSPQVIGTAYLHEGLTKPNIASLKERILAMENVSQVKFKASGQVLADIQDFLGAQTDVYSVGDLFPDVMEITLSVSAEQADFAALSSTISRFPEVSEVDFSEDWLAHYNEVHVFLKSFGVILMILVILGCAFITANFMGIRHQTRRAEIDIVRLIGAPQRFVLKPFLIEGAIEGILGVSLAIAILFLIKTVISSIISVQWSSLLGVDNWMFLSPLQILGLTSLGLLMACLGSLTVFFRFQSKRL